MGTWFSALMTGSRRRKGAAYAVLLKRYDAYLQLLRANNDFLELLSEIEAMGSSPGPCGWDRLRSALTSLNVQVYAMAKMLGRLSDGRYGGLFPVIENLGCHIQARLDQGRGPELKGPLLAVLGESGPFGEGLLGGKAANLCVFLSALPAGTEPAIPPLIPKARVVTTAAFRDFLRHNGLDEMVKMLWDTLDPEEPAHLLETSGTLRDAVLAGVLPPSVLSLLRAEVERLSARLPEGTRFAVRSSASGEDSVFSFAGQYDTMLNVPCDEVAGAVVRVFAGFFNPSAVMLRLKRGFGALELGMGVLVMPMVEGRVSGVAYSRDPSSKDLPSQGRETVRVEAVPGLGRKLVEGAVTPASYLVDRRALGPNSGAGEPRQAEWIEQPLLSSQEILRVAALAVTAETALGTAADVEWTIDGGGNLWLIQARPMALRPAPSLLPGQTGAAVPGWEVLLEGGTPASAGAAAGPVAHVRGPLDAPGLPARFVAVAAEASPDLALLLPRACALVAERGGVASHLAAVSREFGVPAVFGLEGALRALPSGEVVTVDATAGRVYRGKVELLLEAERPQTQLSQATGPVREALLDLLPLVVPLNLLDPASPSFAPSGCCSLHDVVRFIHEKALVEMLRLPESIEQGAHAGGLQIRERMPFDLRLLPLGSGVKLPAEGCKVSLDQVTSSPARALMAGISDPRLKRGGPRPMDPSGFLSVVSGALGSGPELGQPGWALVSDRYLHMSLRMGYHFTTVEAFVGKRPSDNRIRLVFKGGAADETRRQRRARFLAGALEGLGFQVRLKGDFVSAAFGRGTEDQMTRELEQLGRLLVCAAQLDMVLGDESQVRWYVEGFLQGDYARILDAERPAGA